jgi:hypothetical protein
MLRFFPPYTARPGVARHPTSMPKWFAHREHNGLGEPAHARRTLDAQISYLFIFNEL